MISIDFLKGRSVVGNEYLDFQNDSFFKELTDALTDLTDDFGNVAPSGDHRLLTIIEKYTGFANFTIEFVQYSNMMIDSGYISPNNILNNADIDKFLPSSKTTLYRWFRDTKEKVFKGSIDYATGKVHGGFSTFPFTLYIGSNLSSLFPKKTLKSINATLPEAIAGAIVHEIGHAFSGCMMMLTNIEDNFLLKASLRLYKDATTKEERIAVIKDAKDLLDIKIKDDAFKHLGDGGEEEFLITFSNMLNQRNASRALSLGVPYMTSEVLADAYALRMGCHKGISAAVLGLVKKGTIGIILTSFIMGTATVSPLIMLMINLVEIGVAISSSTLIIAIAGLSTFVSLLFYFGLGYSGVYNADHRRFDDLIRQLIDKLKTDKNLRSSERTEFIKQLTKMIKINDELMPWYEHTFVRRIFGFINHLGDFKAGEVEHFTKVIAQNELNVLSERLKSIT